MNLTFKPYICGMDKFISKFSSTYSLDYNTSEWLLSKMKRVNLRKGEYIVKCGEYNDSFYILSKGIWRAFRMNNGEETTFWFAFEGSVVFDVWCYCQNEISPIGIESETECEAYYISKNDLESLCNQSLIIANAIRKIFEWHAFTYECNMMNFLNCENGVERYQSIIKKYPELLQYIPLKKLASYLLVTPQSLSRIRACIK